MNPSHLPSNMPAWYPLWLDPWQLSHNYLNLATELLSESVAQLVRAWHAGHLPGSGFESLPESLSFSPSFFLVFISHLSLSLTLARCLLHPPPKALPCYAKQKTYYAIL